MMYDCHKCGAETWNDSDVCDDCEDEACLLAARADLFDIADLAMVLAAEYHGRKVSPRYVFGEATGGDVFVRMAERAIGHLAA